MNLSSKNNMEMFEIKKGEVLFKEGELVENFYLLASGKVCSFKLRDGRVIPLFISISGKIIAEEVVLSGNSDYCYNAVALEDSTYVKVPKASVFEFLNSNSEWVKNVLGDISTKLNKMYESIKEHNIVDSSLFDMNDLSNEDEVLLKKML